MRTSRCLLVSLFLLVVSACSGGKHGSSGPSALPRAIYVNADVAGLNAIEGYTISAGNDVAPMAGSPWTQSVAGAGYFFYGSTLALHAPTRRAFTTAFEQVTSWDINPSTGVLTSSSVLALPAGDVYEGLTPSGDGSLLFMTSYSSPRMWVLHVAADGTLAQDPGSPFPAFAASGLDCTKLSVDGTRLYGLNGFQGLFEGYAIGSSGNLSPLSGAPFVIERTDGNFERTPDADRFYVAATSSGFIAQFELTTASGKPVETVAKRTPLPSVSVVAIEATGTRLFAVNKSTTLSVFDIAGDGTLSEVAGSPFALTGVAVATSVRVSRDGSLIYVKDTNASEFHLFSIALDGTPTPVAGSPFALPAGATGSGAEFTF